MLYVYFVLFQLLNGYMIFDFLINKEDVKCFVVVVMSLNNVYLYVDCLCNLYNMVIKGMKNICIFCQQIMEIFEDKIKEVSIIDIQLKDLKGNICSLIDLKGKVVLIDFIVYNNVMFVVYNLVLCEFYNKYVF